MTGFVSLVGAGPGDPDCSRCKAVRRLGEADLVLYDALSTPATLGFAAPRAAASSSASAPAVPRFGRTPSTG